ncbi:helix-turn-helix domain-containing protein [Jiangella rhizosphaerae]|uniref:AraC family transcriptional regulator n=1 Tax=Jiangella rhizosphaerae TaxID=2293569 RepID=A0A418KWH5_9ACTN|nr:AraC family transcriptional regulator [Jiangella rhizosphaerae]RIQ34743.1 AraC family transcriptional regulator [Jiangella rhizosphaerae]
MLFRRSRPELAPFVEHLWYVDEPLPPGRDRTLPTGAAQLVVNLAADRLNWYDGADLAERRGVGGAGLCAPLARPIGVDTADQACTAGVVFRPGGLAAFVDLPVCALTDHVTALADVWGPDGGSVREWVLSARTPGERLDVLERLLLARLRASGGPRRDPAVAYAVDALDRGAAVGAVADRLGASASTLRRRFHAAVGLSPKQFARVRRLQRVLRTVTASGVPAPDWAEVAASHGYFDQAHLVNDFRALTGLTPGRYLPRSAAEHNHVPLG